VGTQLRCLCRHAAELHVSRARPQGREKVLFRDAEVGVHSDINDEAQTVYIPEIRTQAYDEKTRIDHSKAEHKVTLYDNVTFTNLLPERDYVQADLR